MLARRCLDKGVPFAVMPASTFAALAAAAELRDAPAALRLLTTEALLFPGTRRGAVSSGGGSESPRAGSSLAGGRLPGQRPAPLAVAAAAGRVRQMLGDAAAAPARPLHVMSPVEYHRLVAAAQHGPGPLQELLLPQPLLAAAQAAATAAAAAAAAAFGAGMVPSADGVVPSAQARRAARMGLAPAGPGAAPGRHRRGGSLGSVEDFCAALAAPPAISEGGGAGGGPTRTRSLALGALSHSSAGRWGLAGRRQAWDRPCSRGAAYLPPAPHPRSS
jgi:hypothetical protein